MYVVSVFSLCIEFVLPTRVSTIPISVISTLCYID